MGRVDDHSSSCQSAGRRACAFAVVCQVALALACGTQGGVQRSPDQAPLHFVEAVSQQKVANVLVIPRFGRSTGVSSGAGHGPQYMKSSYYLAHPFVYESGRPFVIEVPQSYGLRIGAGLFAGRGESLDGVVILANDYRPYWVWNLWDRTITTVELQRLEPGDALALRRRWTDLLKRPLILGSNLTQDELDALGIPADSSIHVQLSDAERRMIEKFLLRTNAP